MPEDIDAQVVMIGLAALSGAFLFLMGMKSRFDRALGPGAISAGNGGSQDAVEVARELEGELRNTAVEVTERIDARVAELSELIERADALLVNLDAALERTSRAQFQGSGFDFCDLSGDQPLDQSAKFREENLDERYAQIFWLMETGLTADQIAKRTGMQRGEVDLVLALRGKTQEPSEA